MPFASNTAGEIIRGL